MSTRKGTKDAAMTKLTADDPVTHSVDVVQSNIEQLRSLFPELVTEGQDGVALNLDVLKQLVGDKTVTDAAEKYGLNWHGKRQARQLALTPSTGTLRPCPEDSVDWDTTQNIMIEGDNLEVLKLLQKSYAGKVKLIYIDPPYNTGKDFVYPDNFQDSIKNYLELTGQTGEGGKKLSSNTEASGRFHTDWLNMMYPRLKLARNILSKDGYLIMSIDDSEVGNLRLACDDIFGGENFIANVVWQKKYTRANDAKFFSANHDHLLVYAKDASNCTLGRIDRGEEQLAAYANPDNHPKGIWKATPLHARSGSNTTAYTFDNGIRWEPPIGTYRRFSEETMRALDEGNEIWFGSDGAQVPSRKSFLSEMDDGMVPVTIWDHKFAGHNHEANDELKTLGLGAAFTSPKPTRLISRMLELFTAKDSGDIVVDFFVGSGTSGHAVLTQNVRDSGNRRFLVVQLPETLDPGNKDQKVASGICEEMKKSRTIAELTKERLRRAGKKIRDEWEAKQAAAAKEPNLLNQQSEIANPQLPDLGFRVFKLASSNIRAWEPDRENLADTLEASIEHIKSDRTEQDILFELLLKLGLDLCVPIERKKVQGAKKQAHEINSVGGGTLLVCLSPAIPQADVEPLAHGLVAWHEELKPAGETTVVFRDSAFADDVAKTNMAAILHQHGLETVRSL